VFHGRPVDSSVQTDAMPNHRVEEAVQTEEKATPQPVPAGFRMDFQLEQAMEWNNFKIYPRVLAVVMKVGCVARYKWKRGLGIDKSQEIFFLFLQNIIVLFV